MISVGSRRAAALVCSATGALVAAAALVCRAPGVLYADAGELLTAVALKGVAHAPGFPLYLILGGLWCDAARALGLPLASSLNAFSSVCDGVAAGGAAAAMLILLKRTELPLAERSRLVLAASAGLLAGFGPTLFDFSLGIEVYAIHAALLSGAIAFALLAGGEDDASRRTRATVLAGLAAGGGLAVHHATMVVALPGIAVLLWGREERRARLRRAALFSAALLPGLATYAVLPIRAARQPPLNWGNPSNLYRIWVHVSARDYQVNIESSLSAILAHAGRFFEAYRAEFTSFGLALAVAGVVLTIRKGRGAALGLLVVILGDVAFAVRYEIAEDQAAYYIPTFLATALLAVAGVAAILAKRRSFERAGVAAAAALALVLSGFHVAARNRAHDGRAPETADNFLASLPPGAFALTPEWNAYAPTLSALQVEKRRPDVLVLDLLLLRRGWYLDTFALRRPERAREVKAELELYRAKLASWEEGRAYDPGELTRLYVALTRKLVESAWKRGAPAVWIGTMIAEHLPTGAALVPSGIGYRVLASRAETAVHAPDAPVSFTYALRRDLPLDETFEQKIRPLYVGMLTQRALYEAAFTRSADAQARLAMAREIDPESALALEASADLIASDGKLDDALTLYARAAQSGGDAQRLAEKSRAILTEKTRRSGTPPPR